jgi:DNA-binding CsgD family transcriptional regulator
VEQYIRNKEFIFDPIPTVAMNQSEPFYWRDVRKLVDPTKDQADILDMREERGILNGLAVQVFGPNQRNGYFGFNFGEEDRSLERTEIFELQWICQLLHARYCTLVKQHQPKIPKLSVRELEILEWVARGKSNSVIADIMGLSAHTVDAYIRRIFLKLGTTDRITATVRGIGMGLIRGATPKKSEGPILKLATKI